MYLLQALIIFAVVGSNIRWRWTEDPLPAWAVTWAIVTVRDRLGR
jgi:hypothetical protein